MTLYLLDTNVCAQVLRNRHALVVQRFQARRPDELRLCSVVKAELQFGALRSQQPAANLALLATFSAPFVSLPFDDPAALLHGQIRADLAVRGTPIGPHDSMIAAIALLHGATVVTHNISEFRRVTGLVVEDWEAP